MTGSPDESASAGDAPDDSIFATTEYATRGRGERAFSPWHRPRKQFVRRHQWVFHIKRLLAPFPGQELRYLCLPGHDLLDVRLLHDDVCEDRRLRFLGFNTGAKEGLNAADLQISLQEVRALPNVDALSEIVPDDVRCLSRDNSQGWKTAREAGPFDVVNLDLCENLLSDAVGQHSIYDAVANLFALQRRRADPWLLLLTTRMDRAAVDDALRGKLDTIIAKNLRDCPPFRRALEHRLQDGLPASDATLVSTCRDTDWVTIFSVALCKWLLTVAASHNATLSLQSLMSYRVASSSSDDDLVSLALLLTPSRFAVPDATGIATGGTPIDECALSAAVALKTARRCRVDVVLAEQPMVDARMTSETGALLAQARYDPGEYRAWLSAI